MEYKVSFTFPSGRIEEIEDTFNTKEEAVDFGRKLYLEVKNNRTFRGSMTREADVITPKKRKPHFLVLEVKDSKSSVVFDSRKDK